MTKPIPDANLPDVIATPEGDGEFAPDEPLAALPDAILIPPGSAPNPTEDAEKPEGVEKFVDEVARGEYM
jgi:hypothetical protein